MDNHVDLERRITQAEQKIDRLELQYHDKSVEMGVINTKLDNINSSVIELRASIKTLMEQPKKRWDTIISTAISTVVSIIVTSVIMGSMWFAAFKQH